MYTWDNVNNLKLVDPDDYYLTLYEEWKVSGDPQTLEELFFISCNVYPVLARNLPPNRLEKYDIVHVVAELQRGYVSGAASDGDRMTTTGSPVQLRDNKRVYTIQVKNEDDHYYIRAYNSDLETVLKWIMDINNVKYYRNHIINEYDMYIGLIAGKQIPLFRVIFLERYNKVYVIYKIDKDIKKRVNID